MEKMMDLFDENQTQGFKYAEDQMLNFIADYITNTYSQHYVGVGGVQAIDVWRALDIDEAAFKSNIVKYAMRYGQKEGTNLRDLLKIIHYAILLMHRNHYEEIIDDVLDIKSKEISNDCSS
jgi:ribosomal protein S17E